MNEESLGKLVLNKRKEIGLTQEELGKMIGYSPQAISKFEEGSASLSIMVLSSLISALNLNINEIVGIEEKQEERKEILPIPLLIKQIKQLRISQKLTQSEFGEKLSLSQRTIRNYEAGYSIPSISFLLKIYEVFSILPSKLIYQNKDLKEVKKRKHKKG